MSIATPSLTNFTVGEISPRLAGRVDLSKYYNACKTLINFHVHPHGGATRRSGMRFVANSANQSAPSLLVPFEFNSEQTYMLEFAGDGASAGVMRVFKDQGRVMSEGQPVQVATPYTQAQLADLRCVQSHDTLILTHPGHPPRKLTRTSHTTWILSAIEFVDQPECWGESNWPATACFFEQRLVLAGTTDHPNTLWFSRTGDYWDFRMNTREVPLTDWDDYDAMGTRKGVEGDTFLLPYGDGFEKDMVIRGRTPDGERGWFRYKGEQSVFADNLQDKTISFRDSPSSGEIHSIHTGGGDLRTDYWEAFALGDRIPTPDGGEPMEDDAIEVTLSGSQANSIVFLAPKAKLWIGTTGGEWTVGGASISEPLTPQSIKANQEGTAGAAACPPQSAGMASLFVQRAGRKIREMAFRYESDGYASRDLTLLSEHITDPSVVGLAYVQEPDGVLYGLRSDGVLIGLTYNPDQDVLAWSRFTTDGEIEAVASVFNHHSSRDELWVQVKRVLNGQTRRFIEFMEAEFDGAATSQAFFLDSALSYAGDAVSDVSGLSHLAGAEVTVLADGLVFTGVPVSQTGTITLDEPATVVHAGLPYESRLETMPLEAGSKNGTAQTKRKRIIQVAARFHNTLGGKIGPDETTLETVHYLTASAPLGQALPVWSGDKRVKFPNGWDEQGSLMIVQDQPLPMTVLLIVPKVAINE